MDITKFEKLIKEFFQYNCLELMTGSKNDEYSRCEDKLHNFKRAGIRRDVPPEEALAGMLEKHLVSIEDMIQDIVDAECEEKQYNVDIDL